MLHGWLVGEGRNPWLAAGLSRRPRFWLGPVEQPLASLTRTCGPELGMPYRERRQAWEKRVGEMVDAIRAGWEAPPLIVNPLPDGELRVADGSHRLEALIRSGIERWWALFWFDSAAARDAFPAETSPHL